MDLDNLISQQLTQNVNQQKVPLKIFYRNNNRIVLILILKMFHKKLNLYAEKYLIDEYKGEWMMWYTLSWPGMPLPTSERNVTTKQLEDFYKEWITLKCYPGEEKIL